MQEDDDFIEVYEDALTPVTCARLIGRFETSRKAVRGETGSGFDTQLKDSWDITLSHHPEWSDAAHALNNAMLKGLVLYLRKYPYAVLSPFVTKRQDPTSGDLSVLGPESLAAMTDRDVAVLALRMLRPGSINIQKYTAGQGGYPHWHSEVYPVAGNPDSLHRTLLWTIYLNDDFRSGETEFFHQRKTIVPKTGAILIAPAGFTHTHRGNRPVGGDKYIATSWILLQTAEALYGKG